jgi:hypothetical protein
MKQKYACDLGVGDTIQLPKNLVANRAKIEKIKVLPTPEGEVLVFDLVSRAANGWTAATATIGFRFNQKVDCIPLHVPLRRRLTDNFWAIFNWCFPPAPSK